MAIADKKLVNLHIKDSVCVNGLRSQIIYYNFDTKKWNRESAFGYFDITDEMSANTAAVQKLKKEIERQSAVKDYSVAAVLMGVVARDEKAPFTDLTVAPKWTGQWFGRYHCVDVLGNAILRNRTTGELAPFTDIWLRCGVDSYTHGWLEGEAAYTKSAQLFLNKFYSAGGKFVHAIVNQKTK